MLGYSYSTQSNTYGAFPPKIPTAKEGEIKELEKLPNEKIFGYFLLSKPGNTKTMDPLVIGCVYYKLS